MVDKELISFIMKKLGVKLYKRFNLPKSDFNPHYFDDNGDLIDCDGFANEYFDDLIIKGDDEIPSLIMKKIGVKPFEKFNIKGKLNNPYYFDDLGYLVDAKGYHFCDRAYFIYNSPIIEKLPPKEMTIEEIEKELGYTIKIVAGKEKKNEI